MTNEASLHFSSEKLLLSNERKMEKMHQITGQVNVHNKPIARGDIRNLLKAYSGAIALDQIRVDALPPASFHPEYSRGMWLRYRRSNIAFIDHLLRTTRDISQQLLQKLNLVACTRDPTVVRKVFVELLSMGATDTLSPGQIDTAPLFFTALVEDVGTGGTWCRADVNAKASFERWLDLIDPLSLAEDPECQYLA
jgi:hypothetical protein